MDENEVVMNGAIQPKTVPLVTYVGGVKRVIGQASIRGDGTVQMTLDTLGASLITDEYVRGDIAIGWWSRSSELPIVGTGRGIEDNTLLGLKKYRIVEDKEPRRIPLEIIPDFSKTLVCPCAYDLPCGVHSKEFRESPYRMIDFSKIEICTCEYGMTCNRHLKDEEESDASS